MRSPDALQLFGIHLVGATPENGRKLLLTLALIVAVTLVMWTLRAALRMASNESGNSRIRFWGRQIVSLVGATVLG